MANAVVQGTSVVSSDTISPYTVNLPTGIIATEQLFVILSYDNSETITTPSGWSVVKTVSSSARVITIYTKTATGSDGSSIDFASTGSLDAVGISFRVSTNQYTTQASAGVAGIDPDSLTTSGSNNYLWIAIVANGAAPSGDPSGYTNIGAGNASSYYLRAAYKQATGITEDPGTFGGSGATSPVSLTLAVTPPTPLSGNAGLLTNTGTIFATEISYGAKGNSNLLAMSSTIFNGTVREVSRTNWTNEAPASTTWTNETL